MKLTKQEAQDVVNRDAVDWSPITGETITDHSRWSYTKERVFQHVPSGKFYLFMWSVGATESQDEGPFEYQDTYEPVEVEAKQKTITVFEPVHTERAS